AFLLIPGFAALAAAQTEVDPGFNLFSTDQEIEIGRDSAQEVERELPVLRDARISGYVEEVGERLAREAPGADYPYQFRVLDVADLNAFALPGGFIYVNRGLLEAVRNEQEFAGVLAHEIGHVALRHGTNQISKNYLAQAGLSVLGGLIGGEGTASDILRVVGGAGLPLLFLKFGRSAEEQADTVGAQMMARAGYDPLALASFFDTLESQSRGGPPEFLSSHPNYESRRENIRREAGLVARANRSPVGGLESVQARLGDMREPSSMDELLGEGRPSTSRQPEETRGTWRGELERPSSRYAQFRQRSGYYTIDYPDNWLVREARDGFGVTLTPRNGIESVGSRQEILGGVIVNHYAPFLDDRDRSFDSFGFRNPDDFESSPSVLREATRDILVQVMDGNPHLQPVSDSTRRGEVDGQAALRAELSGTSPVTGGLERVTVVTREAGDGHVIYLLLIRPDEERDLADAFERMVSSLSVNDRAVHPASQ
ncbi:MAG TPA: M48 family metallopeptidase, partial [Vicinamibacteria bacterium]